MLLMESSFVVGCSKLFYESPVASFRENRLYHKINRVRGTFSAFTLDNTLCKH